MTLIDHKVLISAPPDVIWELVGDLSATPKWHVNCTQASILTTQPFGVGTRCRLNIKGGPDIVLDIVSWYNNLGYEYTVVDGPYKTSRGLVRLQAIHEGTVVQWTLEYQLAGLGAGMRDVTMRRRLNSEIADSLKRLKKLVESTGKRMDDATRERVTMRPAPTADERAALSQNLAKTLGNARPLQLEPSEPRVPITRPVRTLADEDDLPPAPVELTPELEPLVIGEDDLPPPVEPTPDPEPLVIDEDDVPTLPFGDEEPPLAEEDTRPNLQSLQAGQHPDTKPVEVPFEAEPAADTSAEPTPAAEVDLTEPEIEAVTPERLTDSPPTEEADVVSLAGPEGATITEPALEPVLEEAPAVPIDDDEPGEIAPIAGEPESSAIEIETEPAWDAEPDLAVLQEKAAPVGPSIWEVFGLTAPSAASPEAPAEARAAEDSGESVEVTESSPAFSKLLLIPRAGRHTTGLRRKLSMALRGLHTTRNQK